MWRCAFELNIPWVLWLELLLRSAESCLKGSAQTRITPNNSDCLQACLDQVKRNQNLSENLRSGLLSYPQGRELPSPGWYPLLDLKLRFHMFLMSEEAVQSCILASTLEHVT
ncbi:hypothetical protein HID58_005865 [Brassica napus]|uniref:Uncharacterized protein n=1 Tax=Brassica napus TaxID=3708 RepID=A0ABQ8E9S3_BRANA|nr:hypothetical protein HID58_005865 [Brassica napus]